MTLPLDTPEEIPLTVAPATSGVHSAILQVVDPSLSLMIHQIPVTIVAAEDFIESRAFTIFQSRQAPRPGHEPADGDRGLRGGWDRTMV